MAGTKNGKPDLTSFHERAAKLLALAIKAREAGFEEYADRLIVRAMEHLNAARAGAETNQSPDTATPDATDDEHPPLKPKPDKPCDQTSVHVTQQLHEPKESETQRVKMLCK